MDSFYARLLISFFAFTLLLLSPYSKANAFVPQDKSQNKSHQLTEVTWENLCAVSVCRGTGHDGVFATYFSPDGKHLIVDVLNLQKSGLYLLDTLGNKRFLSEGRSPTWLPNGKGIVFIKDNNLWTMSLDDQSPTQLTNDELDVRMVRVSPKGDTISFASARSGYQDIWLMPIDGTAPATAITEKSMPADERRFGYSWSPDGKYIAYFSNAAGYWQDDLWIVDVNTKATKQVSENIRASETPSWSPDGKQIAIFGTASSDYRYTELSDIYIIDVDLVTTKRLAKQITARESDSPKWNKQGDTLFFASHQRGEVELWSVKATGGVATRLTHDGGLLHTFDVSPRGDFIATVRSTPTRGREIDLLSTQGGQLRQLSHFASRWDALVEPQEMSYRSDDGLYIQGFLFTPPNFDENKQYPTLIQVHGGGTHSYYNGLNLVEQRLAQQGFVVIAVNYRGGSGFGREFQDLAANDWANTQALDAAAAAGFVRSQTWSNGKVGIYGYSYGGITSLAAVARSVDAFDAAVPMAGIYDFSPAYYNENRLIRQFIKNGHSGLPSEQPDIYAVSNTIALLKDIKTPVLLMHGENDTIAPFNQFYIARDALTRYNKVFEAHSYAGEPHRFRQPENRVNMYSRLEAWMERWLR